MIDDASIVWLYLGFVSLVLGLLALDLGVFHRAPRVVGVREALGWSAVWITLGLAFAGFVYLGYDHHWFGLGLGPDAISRAVTAPDGATVYNDGGSAVVKYLTGFVVEKSLAVDNIFVIAMIFGALGVPAIHQHRVLFWGIVGALVMRGVMIGVGAQLLARFDGLLYVLGGLLVVTGLKMMLTRDRELDLERSPILRLARRLLRVTDRPHGQRFVVRAGRDPGAADPSVAPDRAVAAAPRGAWLVTPLFLALVLVEVTDVIFAVDSIPAIFAVTTDPFLVFTSNVFALLGMRSLYFALAGMLDRFRYLKVTLSAVLVVIGLKMVAHAPLAAWLGPHLSLYALAAIATILGGGFVASLVVTRAATTVR